MKLYTFFLCVLIVILGLPSISYSAKDTLPPDPSWSGSCDGSVEGYVLDMPNSYERSCLKSITLDPANSYNYILTYDEFIPGKKIKCYWNANVIDTKKDARATIIFFDMAGNDTTIQIDYNALNLYIRPDLDFGIVNLGEQKEMDCWLVNESETSDGCCRFYLEMKNSFSNFSLIDINPIYSISHQDSIKFKVKFTAIEKGIFKDTIVIKKTCECCNNFYNSVTAKVKAIVKTPKIEVSSCKFGDVEINGVKSANITIYNKGDGELIISDYESPENPTIFISDLPEISEYVPLKLNSGQDFSFQVYFLPTREMEYKDSIVFISNADKKGEVDSVAELSGRGVIVESVDNLIGDKEFEIYPNPSDDFLSINFNADTRKSDFVRLLDYYGNVVYENKKIDTQNLKIRTSELASGMYFLKIGDVGMKKVVVVH